MSIDICIMLIENEIMGDPVEITSGQIATGHATINTIGFLSSRNQKFFMMVIKRASNLKSNFDIQLLFFLFQKRNAVRHPLGCRLAF